MKKILIIFLGLALFSCEPQEKPPPADLLPESKFIDILIDVHLAEVMIEKEKLKGTDSSMKLLPAYYDKIYEKHEVADTTFYNTFHYYMDHPHEMDLLYEKLIEEMNKR